MVKSTMNQCHQKVCDTNRAHLYRMLKIQRTLYEELLQVSNKYKAEGEGDEHFQERLANFIFMAEKQKSKMNTMRSTMGLDSID